MIRLAVAVARRAGSGGRPAAGGLPNAAQFNLCRAAMLAGIMTNTGCSDSPKIGEQKLRLDMARAAAAGLQLQVTSACLELQVDDASDGGGRSREVSSSLALATIAAEQPLCSEIQPEA